MPTASRPLLRIPLLAVVLSSVPLWAQSQTPRLALDGDFGWKFLIGDPADAETPGFNDRSWRTIDLPHDWSIEEAPKENNPTGPGGGYFAAGIGWYRKAFTAPRSWQGKRIGVEFDGVASNATVYLNGKELGIHPYAYTSFRVDLTPELDFSKSNLLAVRVDNSEQPSSRWYGGSGIYRHVRVLVTDRIHVAPQGIFVSTPEASAAGARVLVETQLENDSPEPGDVSLTTTLRSADGRPVGTKQAQARIDPGTHTEIRQEISLTSPKLWFPESPSLYKAVTDVLRNGKVVDRVETIFGVRSLAWSVDQGLVLNGRSIKLIGGSVHHDNGPLGAAAFDRAEERRVELLKAAGFNAVRTAHNPPSPAFLDACDRQGLLVLDEPFDVWTKSKAKYDYARFFNDWWQKDIDSMVLRDRNHPSIVFWGIGNEIPEAWTKDGAPIARKLAERVRALDNTRPLTEAFPGATYTASTDAVMSELDVTGYNYNLVENQARDHERVPRRIMMTTESLPATAFEQWKTVHEHPYILGEFVWTAMDYLGESGIGSWSYTTPQQAAQADQIMTGMKQMMSNMGANGENPFEQLAQKANAPPNPVMKLMFPGFPWHAASSGDLDLIGHRKPQSYYRDFLWNGGNRVFPTVRLPEPEGKKIVAVGWSVYPTLPSWTWPGQEGKDMQIEVYSGTEKVRLFLNDKLIGELPTGVEQQRKALFTVTYMPGTLKAVGLHGDQEVANSVLETAEPPSQLRLEADRTDIQADGQDLSFVTIQALDQKGRLQPTVQQDVKFILQGPGKIIAVGNGDGTNRQSYVGDHIALFNGRALVVIRSTSTPGSVHLVARAEGLRAGEVLLRTERVASARRLE